MRHLSRHLAYATRDSSRFIDVTRDGTHVFIRDIYTRALTAFSPFSPASSPVSSASTGTPDRCCLAVFAIGSCVFIRRVWHVYFRFLTGIWWSANSLTSFTYIALQRKSSHQVSSNLLLTWLDRLFNTIIVLGKSRTPLIAAILWRRNFHYVHPFAKDFSHDRLFAALIMQYVSVFCLHTLSCVFPFMYVSVRCTQLCPLLAHMRNEPGCCNKDSFIDWISENMWRYNTLHIIQICLWKKIC